MCWVSLGDPNVNCDDTAAESRQKLEAGWVRPGSHGQSLAAVLTNLSTVLLQTSQGIVGPNCTVCSDHQGGHFCTSRGDL